MRNKQVHRILGTMPTIAVNAYRHRIGRSYNKPHADLGYVEVTNRLESRVEFVRTSFICLIIWLSLSIDLIPN